MRADCPPRGRGGDFPRKTFHAHRRVALRALVNTDKKTFGRNARAGETYAA